MRSRLKQFSAEAILTAAEEVFAEDGLDARMETIAAKAGVAVGTLYNHFKDRDALLEALFEARRGATIARVEAALAETAAQPFRARLTATLHAMVNTAAPQSKFKRVLFQSNYMRRRRPSSQGTQELLACLAPVIQQGHKEKALRADPHGLQPSILLGILQTALTLAFDEPSRIPVEDVPEMVTQQFVDGARR